MDSVLSQKSCQVIKIAIDRRAPTFGYMGTHGPKVDKGAPTPATSANCQRLPDLPTAANGPLLPPGVGVLQ